MCRRAMDIHTTYAVYRCTYTGYSRDIDALQLVCVRKPPSPLLTMPATISETPDESPVYTQTR